MLVARAVRYRFRGLSWRTTESTGGGRTQAFRGRSKPRLPWNRLRSRRPCSTTRRTTARYRTRSAAVTCGAWAMNARIAAVSAYGGLATTRKGRPGATKFSKSHSTTEAVWSLTFSRNRRARPAWSSTAMTRAPASSNGSVRAPIPAPRSTTSSPGRIAAPATMRSAQSGSSRCQPHGRRPDTTHREDDHHDRHTSDPLAQAATQFPQAAAQEEDDHRSSRDQRAIGPTPERPPA
jgi:hypothetical protein